MTPDPVSDTAPRLYREFQEHTTLSNVIATIEQCRNELDTPSEAALPELIERLARQRLADQFPPHT